MGRQAEQFDGYLIIWHTSRHDYESLGSETYATLEDAMAEVQHAIGNGHSYAMNGATIVKSRWVYSKSMGWTERTAHGEWAKGGK